jgi:hypothetical protein
MVGAKKTSVTGEFSGSAGLEEKRTRMGTTDRDIDMGYIIFVVVLRIS